jgi:hypothetical protein
MAPVGTGCNVEHAMLSPGVPYDCDSIMHFGTETFSLGRPTMEARDKDCDLR